jgi:hypothetical protein
MSRMEFTKYMFKLLVPAAAVVVDIASRALLPLELVAPAAAVALLYFNPSK